MVLTLEARKRIEDGRWNAMSELESLLFTYGLEYPKVVHKGTDPQGWDVSDWGPQNAERLYGIYASYAVTICDQRRKEGLSPTPQELLADVLLACENVRPSHPELVNSSDFRTHILEVLKDEKELANLRPRQCDPLFWRHFSCEKTSKTSRFRDYSVNKFVSLSVPAGCTNRDVVERIAEESDIPLDSLPDDLNLPVFSRGRAIFGFAGDEFDQIADNYDNIQWWLSDGGLNMAIVSPSRPPSIPTFDDLMQDIHGSSGSGGPESDPARVPLPALLREAEGRTADPKLRKKLVAVLQYQRYFEDLRVLKAACKRYQTPALLEQQFPNLDVWAPLDDADKADIAKGNFQPGLFAWSLVKRVIGLSGHHNRTLKNYRSALRKAGLL